MSFRSKIFLAILLSSFIFSFILILSTYFIVKSYTKKEFISRYVSLGNMIGNTFREMENLSNQVNRNAAYVLNTVYQYSVILGDKKIPGNRDLKDLAKKIGIQGFYVINQKGRF